MISLNEFMVLAVVHLLAIASPGPNVIASITNSITHGVRAGVLTSLGVSIGNLFHIGLGIFGITVLITRYPEVSVFVSVAGVSYLAYLGTIKIRRGLTQKKSTELISDVNQSENFLLSGIIINVTNLKGALFFLMAFSTLIPISQNLGIKIFYGFWMAGVNFLFLSSLAWFFGKRKLTGNRSSGEKTVNIIGGAAYLIVASLILFSALQTFGLW